MAVFRGLKDPTLAHLSTRRMNMGVERRMVGTGGSVAALLPVQYSSDNCGSAKVSWGGGKCFFSSIN